METIKDKSDYLEKYKIARNNLQEMSKSNLKDEALIQSLDLVMELLDIKIQEIEFLRLL